MTIIYRTSGPWGAGKGANLVPGEVDGNFYDTDRRLAQIEDNMPAAAKGIAFFAVDGNLFYVHMTDGTIQGPYALPKAQWNFRGAWQPSTVYYADDVITANGSTYLVVTSHMSGFSFNPGANDGSGNMYYGLLLTNPSNVLPAGGLAGQYLVKTDSTIDFDVDWQTPVVFPSQAVLEAPDPTYSLKLTNIASYVRCVNASGCTITIPADATLLFPLGTEISFRQCTDSGVILVPASGVLFNVIAGFSAQTARNGAVITSKKIAANNWDIFGYLSS